MRLSSYTCLFLAVSFLSVSCTTVPLTGRKQFNLIPSATMLSMSFQQYDEFLNTHTVSKNQQQTQMVKTVGKRVQKAVESYFSGRNMAYELDGYNWTFNLVEDSEVNAWCMPGGKVVVYTGMWSVVTDEAGLAVVIGHEVAHAVANHGSERLSEDLVTELGGMALSKALEEKPEKTRQLWMTAFGLGAQVGFVLPYSRLQESEADHLGLIFMAMAGYDPNRAVTFWEKMSQMQGGKVIPEFVSTHPSDATRIQNIKKLLPEAMKYYKKT